METPIPKKPMTMAELLPRLHSSFLTEEAKRTLTGMKVEKSRSTIAASRTAEKYKPMTMAEMAPYIKALSKPSPVRNVSQTSSMRKKWNSSVKVLKKSVSVTDNTQIKHTTVRKVLNFPQPKPKENSVANNPRRTINPGTTKFIKPEVRPKKALQENTTVRISGVFNIAETPVHKTSTDIVKTVSNKENIAHVPVIQKQPTTPKSSLRKRLLASRVPDTPLSNESWKSSCDDSFLQNEKDVELESPNKESETKTTAEDNDSKSQNNYNKINDTTLENITEELPQVSTPFKLYRNMSECFHDSSDITQDFSPVESPILQTGVEEAREESVIVSLCDMLNKATVSQTNTHTSTDLRTLLEVKNQALNKLKMIENGIKTLNSLKESELKTLEYVNKLIGDKERTTSESDNNKTVVEVTKESTDVNVTPIKTPVIPKPCSVIKSCLKSPSYKIPRKSSVKKKVHYRPSLSHQKVTPEKNMGERAMGMYMAMKESMNFLTTPAKNHRPLDIMDTPTAASHNLQKQLDKLYNDS